MGTYATARCVRMRTRPDLERPCPEITFIRWLSTVTRGEVRRREPPAARAGGPAHLCSGRPPPRVDGAELGPAAHTQPVETTTTIFSRIMGQCSILNWGESTPFSDLTAAAPAPQRRPTPTCALVGP
ncbi:hypothetical protein EVAR_9758_1 [Eumeta japonica]|uniref:Uncharacterized protein n=1 Tax=Eumeta variegata TaxID=151549 RepID=A0A4C1U5A8_EUMVA|nr:hypothetical protein EVAR_9758_1 [Eumeta japonica]